MQRICSRILFPPLFLLAFLIAGVFGQNSAPPASDRVILTPQAGQEPRINGPRVFGARPDRPFLYRIPCTGLRPIQFQIDGLPDGLLFDSQRGVIQGRTPGKAGSYSMTFRATNRHGASTLPFELVVGETLALTPPMGWNSWYIHYYRVTDRDMREAADAMIASGMADYGYMYVNIDDCWMVEPEAQDPKRGGRTRDEEGRILPNAYFPDMNALTDYIHGLGLRAGLYTSPGPLTCQRYTGSYEHEEIDARRFAEWGFDFLKYDWCSYGRIAPDKSLENLRKPYEKMGEILAGLNRDIVFNLCQYGMGDVWEWGGEVRGNCWRTTGDLGLEKATDLPGFYHVGFSNAAHFNWARPGQWNDPDYILIGWVGDAHQMGVGTPTSLTDWEQFSYMSMWSLMAAPLIFSGDMTRLDDFTLNVLCNSEVIHINQDPLGRQARVVRRTEDDFVLAKPLLDGSLAVGLFNLRHEGRQVSVSSSDLGLSGARTVRDLWRQKDLERFEGSLSGEVPGHGVLLVRLSK